MYFTRHMRILEHCSASAGPDMQVQIDALREAFSSDTNRPFELKPSLGSRTPSEADQEPTPAPSHAWKHFHDSKTMSPASGYEVGGYNALSTSSPLPYTTATSAYDLSYSNPNIAPSIYTAPVPDPQGWDPSGIFTSWNHAFGAAGQTPPQAPQMVVGGASSLAQPTSTGNLVAATVVAQHVGGMPAAAAYSTIPADRVLSNVATLISEAAPLVPNVTPVMWQDAFANAFESGHGHKRFREESELGCGGGALGVEGFERYAAKRRG